MYGAEIVDERDVSYFIFRKCVVSHEFPRGSVSRSLSLARSLHLSVLTHARPCHARLCVIMHGFVAVSCNLLARATSSYIHRGKLPCARDTTHKLKQRAREGSELSFRLRKFSFAKNILLRRGNSTSGRKFDFAKKNWNSRRKVSTLRQNWTSRGN